MDSPASSTHTGGASSRLQPRPTTAPIRVSTTRAQAVFPTVVTPRTSIALIATSGTYSSTLTSRPTTSAATISRARLHQVRPTSRLNAIATSTPVTTAVTRRMPLVRVA